MKLLVRLIGAGGVIAGMLLAAASPAAAYDRDGLENAVLVQTDDPAGNAVWAYHRSADGDLTAVARYRTGGRGGAELGAPGDPLASQGSLTYDAEHRLLFAVNAGSDSISVFDVHGDRLRLRQVVSAGGPFPTSIAVHEDLVYVLDAGLAGGVQGYRIAGRMLRPLPGSFRSLGLGNTNPPVHVSAPGQVGFTPDGTRLIVTTKLHGTIDVFALGSEGRPSSAPTVNASAGPVPFAFAFDPAGHLLVTEAGSGSVTSYRVGRGGALTVLDASVRNGQALTCWIAPARGFFYVSNTGSATLSGYAVNRRGSLSLIHGSNLAAVTPAAPIDLGATRDGRYLYLESGVTGSVVELRVAADGSLSSFGGVTGLPITNGLGAEGIVVA
jgi:DNA-binding beta-propeller fold protein YncE